MMWAIKHKSGRVLFVTSDEFIADNRRKMGWIVEEVKMTSREQFESWWSSAGRGLIIINADIQRQLQWNAWQASRAAVEIELPEAESTGCTTGYYAEDVIEAIESAGLKVKK